MCVYSRDILMIGKLNLMEKEKRGKKERRMKQKQKRKKERDPFSRNCKNKYERKRV